MQALEVGMRWLMRGCNGRSGASTVSLAEFVLFCGCIAPCSAAQKAELSPTVEAYVRVRAGKVVLTHVRVIDGTGAAALEDRNITIENGKITAIEAGGDAPGAPGASVL